MAAPSAELRGAQGVQVGDQNTQYNYYYGGPEPAFAETAPFERFGSELPIFGGPGGQHLVPAFAEFAAGQIDPGPAGQAVADGLSRGSVLLLGRGAVGKTTLAAWVGVRHAVAGGTGYYLDLAGIDNNETGTLLPRLVEVFDRLTAEPALVVLDNIHRNEAVAAALLRRWRSRPASGRLLLVGRHTATPADPRRDTGVTRLVDQVTHLTVDGDDLVHSYTRLAAHHCPAGGVPRPTPETVRSWLTLFGGDRLAFGLAVTRHLEREGAASWLASGGALSSTDAISYVREGYLDEWPAAREGLLRLAAGASLEIAVPEDALDTALLAGPLAAGIVQRTVHGLQEFRRYALIHPGLGALLLAAGRVGDTFPILRDVARLSAFTGFCLAARLETTGRADQAAEILAEMAGDPHAVAVGLLSPYLSSNLDRLARLRVLTPAQVDEMLVEAVRPAELAGRLVESVTGALTFLSASEHRLPRLFEAAHGLLAEPSTICRLADAGYRDAGQTRALLAFLGARWPGLADELVAALRAPQRAAQVVAASCRAVGQTGAFLAFVASRWPEFAAELVAALRMPDGLARLATAGCRDAGEAATLLSAVVPRWPVFGGELVAALRLPDRLAQLAAVGYREVGQTAAFLAQVVPRWPAFADELVALLRAPDRVGEFVAASCRTPGEAGAFLAFVASRWPAFADELVATLRTPGQTELLAAACDRNLGHTGALVAQLSQRWPDVADELVAALQVPQRLARLAVAGCHDVGQTAAFLSQVCTRWPALADALVAALGGPERMPQLAEAGCHDVGQTGAFLVQVGQRWPGFADELVAALRVPERLELLAAACCQELGQASAFLSLLASWRPDFAAELVAALRTAQRVDRLADLVVATLAPTTARFLRCCRADAPALFDDVIAAVCGSDRLDGFAGQLAGNFRYAGGLLRGIQASQPAHADRLLAAVTAARPVSLLLHEPRPSETLAAAAQALVAVVGWLHRRRPAEAVPLSAALLSLFRQGYHLGARIRLRDLADLVCTVQDAGAPLADDVLGALASAGRSAHWLDREFATVHTATLAAALDQLWWSEVDVRTLRAMAAGRLADRVADELALAAIARRTPQRLADVLRLAGLLVKLATPSGPAAGPVGAVGAVAEELPGSLAAVADDPDARLAVWAGLYALRAEVPLAGFGPAEIAAAVADWEAALPRCRRPDQQALRQAVLDWLTDRAGPSGSSGSSGSSGWAG